MTYPHIWDNELVGGHTYHGLTLGGIIDYTTSLTFIKADYPGLRAVRHLTVMTLAKDLSDSQNFSGGSQVELWY